MRLSRRGMLAIVLIGGSVTGAPAASAETTPRCFNKPATVLGTHRSETLTGTSGRDVIVGLGGADVISGRAGDDLVCSRKGSDVVAGGLGDDRLAGGEGTDGVDGGEGDDRLFGRQSNDQLSGGPGDDFVKGGPDSDTVTYQSAAIAAPKGVTADLSHSTATGEGVDSFKLIENLVGSPGDDTLIGDRTVNEIRGWEGDDVIRGRAGADFLAGEDNFTSGTGGSDRIVAGPGEDTLIGSGIGFFETGGSAHDGPSVLSAGHGDDVLLHGEDGDYAFFGDEGTDVVSYDESGPVRANLTSGTATGFSSCLGAFPTSYVDTFDEVENLTGSVCDDLLIGDEGPNTLAASALGAIVDFGEGTDTLLGLRGDDTLLGARGPDQLTGNEGNDVLDAVDGESGNDLLGGNDGTDTCRSDPGDSRVGCER